MPIPPLTEFSPFKIPWQGRAVESIRGEFDYSQGVQEVLLSGSLGSAKSCLIAHLAVTHCLFNKGARALVARRSMPDLKDSILNEILEHIEGDLIEGIDYTYNRSRSSIKFLKAKSEIITRSWADGRVRKFRSLILSAAFIEELTESEDGEFYKEIKMRVGRIPEIEEQLIVAATNPDDELHWAHEYFIEGCEKYDNRHVFYSLTEDNPFLPPTYIKGLKESLSGPEADRMLRGKWGSISKGKVYSSYDSNISFKNYAYEIDYRYPIDLMFDFNIGLGKPFSFALGQHIDNNFHCFKDFILEGCDTPDAMDELFDSGIYETGLPFRVFGDASGKNSDTRSKASDYDIIKKHLKAAGVNFEIQLPAKNPPLRRRHNRMNALFKNDNGKTKFFIYKGAAMVNKGFKLVKLKKGADYLEDDNNEYQHVTTAVGYWCDRIIQLKLQGRSKKIQL